MHQNPISAGALPHTPLVGELSAYSAPPYPLAGFKGPTSKGRAGECCGVQNILKIDSEMLTKKGKGSPYSITECGVPELIPVLCSQPAGDVSHKPGGRLPLLSAKPAVTTATLNRAATNFAAW